MDWAVLGVGLLVGAGFLVAVVFGFRRWQVEWLLLIPLLWFVAYQAADFAGARDEPLSDLAFEYLVFLVAALIGGGVCLWLAYMVGRWISEGWHGTEPPPGYDLGAATAERSRALAMERPLRELLEPGERVEAVVYGLTDAGGTAPTETGGRLRSLVRLGVELWEESSDSFPCALALTDWRLLYLDKRGLVAHEHIDPAEVTELTAQTDREWFEEPVTRLSLRTRRHAVVLRPTDVEELHRFLDLTQRRLSLGTAPRP